MIGHIGLKEAVASNTQEGLRGEPEKTAKAVQDSGFARLFQKLFAQAGKEKNGLSKEARFFFFFAESKPVHNERSGPIQVPEKESKGLAMKTQPGKPDSGMKTELPVKKEVKKPGLPPDEIAQDEKKTGAEESIVFANLQMTGVKKTEPKRKELALSEVQVQVRTERKTEDVSAKRASADTEGKGRNEKEASQAAASEKRTGQQELIVIDLRQKKPEEGVKVRQEESFGNALKTDRAEEAKGSEPKFQAVRFSGSETGRATEVGHAAEQTSDFRKALLEQLQSRMNGDIVKQASVVLQKDGSGDIHLVLKPESLGKVRIRVHLEDNSVAGRIFVENMQVKEVFEQNLASLERAFQFEGFKLGNLEVSVGNGRSDAREQKEERRFRIGAVEAFEESVPRAMYSLSNDSLVNLMA